MRVLVISRAGILGTIAALVVVVMCVRFGFWQLDRWAQRAAVNETIHARITMPPLALSPGTADSTGLLYRRVLLTGEPDHGRTLVWTGRTLRGSPGVHLVVPVRSPGREPALLVDRGFVPSPDAYTVDVDVFPAAEPLRIEGIVLPMPDVPWGDGTENVTGRTFHRLGRAPLELRLPYALAPFYVRASSPTSATSGFPRPAPLPELDSGPHLGYAVQWFAFAAIALVGWVVLMLRGGGGARTPPGGGVPGPRDELSPPAPPG